MTTQTQHAGPDERDAFEAWYCADAERQGLPISEGIKHLRDGNHYGTRRVMLDGKWEGWQARAALLAEDKGGEAEGPAGSGGWKFHAEQMERERDHWRARAQTMYEHQRGEVWYWQGDGEDHLKSMVNALPVVIRAEQLRDLLATHPQQQADSKAGGEVFGWFMRLGTYAPVFLEQSNPPHPFTFEEAVAEGWRPLYIHPQQQAAQAAVPQWHPIETAPKDGTVILVADTFTYRRDPDKKPHHVYRAVRWDEESYGWEIYNDGEIIDQDGPTFWMPLPAEPGSMLSAAPVAAPVEHAAVPQWQTIETAPKDGTMFLCWVSAVRYGETDEGQQYQQDASQPDFCWWRDGSDGNGYFDPACGQIAVSQDVTHWMPLPAAPVEQKGNLCVNCEADGKCMKRQALCYASGTAQAYSPERLQEVALLRRRVSELEEELAVSDKLLDRKSVV